MNKHDDVRLTPDVNFLAGAPVRALLALENKRREAQAFLAETARALHEAAPFFLALESLDVDVRFSADSRSIDVCFAGDGAKLGEVWTLMRRAGWGTPSSRPQKGAIEYCAFWHHATLPRIWLSFSSTTCRRVQVGARLVEQPIYETHCSDLPELPSLDDVPALEASL